MKNSNEKCKIKKQSRETKIKLIEALKTSTGKDISNSLYNGID